MSVLRASDRQKLADLFTELQNDVTVVVFTQEMECEFCKLTHELMDEVASLSPRLRLEIKDFVADAAEARRYGVDKIPAVILLGDRDYGIRFYGIPAGYEFATLVEDILDVSRRDPRLPREVLVELAKVDRAVHLQAMVSPTCPYCPQAVRNAHRFAMASEYIRGDMVEVTEFPFLAMRYDVQSVPVTIVNEEHSVLGALPELEAARAVLHAIGKR